MVQVRLACPEMKKTQYHGSLHFFLKKPDNSLLFVSIYLQVLLVHQAGHLFLFSQVDPEDQ